MKLNARNSGIEAVGRNFLWMVWSAGISIANSLVLWIFLARMRDVEELGRFTVVMGLYTLFMTVCTLGLAGYLVVEISRRRSGPNAHRGGAEEAFIANASLVMLGSGVLAAVSMCLFGFWASRSQEVVVAAAVLSLAVLPSGLISLGEAAMVAYGRTRVIGLVSTLENLLRTLIPILLIWAGFGLVAIVLSLVATRYVALAVYVVLARRNLSEFRIDLAEVKAILLAAPTFAGTVVLSSIVWQGAVVLLGSYSSEAETAKFGVASRFLVPAAVLLASYADVIQPLLARVADRSKKITAMYLMKFLRLPLGVAILAAITSPFLSTGVLSLLFGEKYASSAAALNIFAICLVPFCLIMIIARALFAQKKQRYDLFANVVGAAVFLASAVMLIPGYGAVGAATAQLSALVSMALLEGLFITKVLAGSSVSKNVRSFRKPRMLMIGMHLTKTRGGITTLTAAIHESSISQEFEIVYIASQAEEFGKITKFFLAANSALRVVWHCLASRPDLVYVHIGSNASLYREGFLMLLAKTFRCTVVTHFHAGDVEIYYSKQSYLGRLFIRTAISKGDKIIAVSAAMARSLAAIVRCDQVVVLPNAIDTKAFRPGGRQDRSSVKLLFVGAVGKLKGEKDLLHALARLREIDVDLEVSMIGFGAERLQKEVEQLRIADMVEYLGPVPSGKMPEQYAAADIFVLPTYAEGMPMSVLEAMSSGLAVVTTNVGGIPELIDEAVNGFMVEPGDVDELAAKIRQLAMSPQLRRRVGENARIKALREFDNRGYQADLREHLNEPLTNGASRVAGVNLIAKRAAKSVASFVRKPQARAGVNIIAYHRVAGDVSRAERDGYYGLSVSTESFRKHCEILKANYEVMPLETAARELATGSIDRPIAVLTFDDGYLDFYEQAFPVLKEFGLPATMFLPTDFVNGSTPLAHDRIFWLLRCAEESDISLVDPLLDAGVYPRIARSFATPSASLALTERLVYLPFRLREQAISSMGSALGVDGDHPPDYRLLDWTMIREMATENISFGAHTVNHVVLTLEDSSTIVSEVEQSRIRLEREIGMQVQTFAYPNGEHNDLVRSAVAKAGFTVAVTTKPAVNVPGGDLLALGRTSLCEESTRGISGSYSDRVARMRLGV